MTILFYTVAGFFTLFFLWVACYCYIFRNE